MPTVPDTTGSRLLTVLVVDDSRLQRHLLAESLDSWGYEVFEAQSGKDALEICKATRVDLILSDWMMPEMDGLTFCREFRALEQENYSYFILLTSKDTKNEIARGLDVGADDFLTKPVNSVELKARLQAGERVLAMQHELVEKNRSISSTLNELQELYQTIDRDLVEAQKLQKSLLPETFLTFEKAQLSLMLRSTGHIGGDMVGLYNNTPERIGLFAFDVSGHGVSSALMTARLAGYLSTSDPSNSIAMKARPDGSFSPRSPGEIASMLNDRMLQELDSDLYLTLLLADVNLVNRSVEFVQAGHPHPAHLRKNGSPEFLGAGGLPIGLIPGAGFGPVHCQLSPGDSLLIYSDGFTEAENASGDLLGEDGLVDILGGLQASGGPELLADIVWETQAFSGGGEVSDDLSAILLEFSD